MHVALAGCRDAWCNRIMATSADTLPDDPGTLKAMLLAERARAARLEQIIRELQRHRFGRRAETLPEDQLLLGREEVEQVEASSDAPTDAANAAERSSRAARRRRNRGALPAHLPRVEMLIDLDDHACPCCQRALHRIGEDVSERLDIVPAQFRVLVVRRPKYACRACETMVQAPAPARLIEGGLPTEATVAQVLVAKYADHLPLYRQAQIYARQGLELDRSTLADWVGRAAFLLRPVQERLLARLKQSTKLFADETTAPVLDPGRGRTKTGQLWAYARDDRPWGGTDPPAVAYVYAPDRKAERPIVHLAGFAGILQVDGYAGGGEHWAVIASLIETCKLIGIEPQTYLADVITRIVNDHPNSQIDELQPWAYLATKNTGAWPENIAYESAPSAITQSSPTIWLSTER